MIILTREELKSDMAQFVGNLGPQEKFPGIFVRELSFLVDGLLSLFIFYFLMSFPVFFDFVTGYLQSASTFFTEGLTVKILAILFLLYLVTQVVRFLSILFLGKSLGQKVAGIENFGLGLPMHLNGAGKVVIDTLLFPFLFITHFGLLKGDVSWVERWLEAPLRVRRDLKSSLLRLGLCNFIFLLLALPAPMLATLFLEYNIQRISQKTRISLPIVTTDPKLYLSKRFGFKTVSNLSNQRFVLLPFFEFIQLDDKVMVIPWPQIYDKTTKSVGALKAVKKINLWKVIESYYKLDPLFAYTYPKLATALAKKNEEQHDDLVYKELEELIFYSLSLDMSQYLSELWIKGPFVLDKVLLKIKLGKLLPLVQVKDLELVSLGDGQFIKMKYLLDDYHLQSWHAYALGGSLDPLKQIDYRSFYLSLGQKTPMILEFLWEESDMKNAPIASEFIETFFSSAKWENLLDEDLLKNFKQFTPFTIMDFLTQTKLSDEAKQKVYDYTIQYYVALGKSLWKSPDPTFQTLMARILSNNIGVVDQMLKIKSPELEAKKLSELRLKLSNIKYALDHDRIELFLEDSIPIAGNK